MLTKIISGLQTGADLAALDAAIFYGYETGGWMPLGYFNQTGNHPEYAKKYNAKQLTSRSYKDRTWRNIKDRDGTLIFAGNFTSPGTICTLRGIAEYNKPFELVQVQDSILYTNVINWMNENKIKVLNVAGNSEKSWPGIYSITYECMLNLLKFYDLQLIERDINV